MSEIIASIEQGKLLGKTLTNIKNKPFYSFQGIPYAKPPLGNLRFKAPQPPEPWSGTRDATEEASPCYSRHMVYQNMIGAEDCLFLNVYTPELPTPGNKSLRPVMFWIHGGAFRSGSSKTDVYGPEYLMTEDIVLVTINYRFHILGFLQFEDASLEVPGNAGMKDMVMALQWVQKNISNFSGDPNNVTIFGESAGGASVHHLVLSPLAKNLFHKAIAQSGCALNCFARGRSDIVSTVASILELKDATEKQIYQHLVKMTVEELFELSEKVAAFCERLNNGRGKLAYAPLIEKPSPSAFLSDEPIDIIKSGNYNHVPIIFGYTTTEGMLIEVKIKPRKPTMPGDFEAAIPYTLKVERGSEASKSIANKIKEFYYGEPGSEDKLENFYKIHTDNHFLRDIMFSAQHHAATSKFPVYLYRMSIDTSLNVFKKAFGITAPGVAHGDDLAYLFKTRMSPPQLEPGSLEELSVQRFVTFWTNFAKRGSPGSEWKPVKRNEVNFVDIGEEIVPGVNPEAERMAFWKDIFSINPSYTI